MYKDYFKNHYKYSFSAKDIHNYRNWFYVQWNFINKILKIKSTSSVLEIGSGIGGFYTYIESECKNYKGIELDKEAVEFSVKYFDAKVFVISPLENFNPKVTYDEIFAFEVLEHLLNPLESLVKINKLLKKGGFFCGTSPFPYSKNIIPDETHWYVLHPDNWERLFLNAGFKNVKLYPMTFFPFIWRINKRLNIRIPFYLPFKSFVSTTLIIAEK